MKSKEQLKNIAENYANRVWNQKDLSAIDEFFHPEAVIHSLLGKFYGQGSMKKVVQTWLTAFPDLVVHNLDVLTDKDIVVIHWEAKGTHLGDFKGKKGSKKGVNYRGVTLYRIQNEKIIEYWAYLDMQHILNQIG